ncbi:SRPBCC family protein [Sinomonas mesophila]|uniref:SRPBCC family protein n=1 Tax=Sinomonas mesophila TaxID=1531955 RepID=UPI0009876EA7|nr:SRPBCC family protein [Sinomonas mesophila]
MHRFGIALESPLLATAAWDRVLDLRAHSRVAPLTRITVGAVAARELRAGHRFVAHTALGAVGFDDVMTVAEVSPPEGSVPGRARIVKSGRVIRGEVVITVSAHDGGSIVRWEQDFALGRLGGPLGRLAARAARLAYRRALRRLLAG